MKTAIYSTTREAILNANVTDGKELLMLTEELACKLVDENPSIKTKLLINELAIFAESVILKVGKLRTTNISVDHIGPLKQFTVYGTECQFDFMGLGSNYFGINVHGYNTQAKVKLNSKSLVSKLLNAFNVK